MVFIWQTAIMGMYDTFSGSFVCWVVQVDIYECLFLFFRNLLAAFFFGGGGSGVIVSLVHDKMF